MTVSKNFDLIDIMKRCNERKKAHYESKHPVILNNIKLKLIN